MREAGRHRAAFERLYESHNRYRYIYPDPLIFVYRYSTNEDRELAGFLASSLAYGRVIQIHRSLEVVFSHIGSPLHFLETRQPGEIFELFEGFRHRFTGGGELARLLIALGRVIDDNGSLESCFRRGMSRGDENFLPALSYLVAKIKGLMGTEGSFLVPDPAKGSAVKRLNLFLRWMIRKDRVDPGPWEGLSRRSLIIPLDTHMYRVGLGLGYTRRKQPDLKAALEMTAGFRALNPEDPVKYDFVLSRPSERAMGSLPAIEALSKRESMPAASVRSKDPLPPPAEMGD
jgi:uncharacterized protein (TIGR02757 family)